MHHGEGLRRLVQVKGGAGEDPGALVEALVSDPRTAGRTGRERAILGYVVKLTEAPGAVEAADIESLRSEGLDDRAIHDICAIAGYYAFVNRIADGLGVELEPGKAP